MNRQIMLDNGLRAYTAVFARMVFLVAVALSLAGCGGGGGGGPAPISGACQLTIQEIEAIGNIDNLPPECLSLFPVPDNNLLGRLFILGTQVDSATNALRIFAHGTNDDGTPLELADFETAVVSIGGTPADPNLWSVEPIADGDDVLSIGFATDYSLSIPDPELNAISGVFSDVLDNLSLPPLPQVLEGMAINFALDPLLQQDWTEDPALLGAAFQVDADLLIDDIFRNGTAFFDALGFSLQRDVGLDSDGLVERCRPAHMQIAFTDGVDNASFTYTKETLLPIIDDSKVVMIMLGSLNADVDELTELGGDLGGFAYAINLAGIQDVVQKWADSLGHIVKFTLDPATGFDPGPVTIELGGLDPVVVERPVDGFCESDPVM